MKKLNQEENEIDVLELLFVLLRKWWILLSALVVGAIISGLITILAITPMYDSTSKLYILTSSTSLTSLADIQIGTSLTKDYVQLVQSRPVVEKVIENLKLDWTYDEMLKSISVTNAQDTRILVITAQNPDPELAKDIANQFAEVSRSSISTIMKTDEPSIVEYGIVAEKPVSPSKRKNIAIGGAVGFLLAAVVIVVLHLLDDKIKTAEDVEKYLDLTVLAAVPLRKEEKGKKKGEAEDGK